MKTRIIDFLRKAFLGEWIYNRKRFRWERKDGMIAIRSNEYHPYYGYELLRIKNAPGLPGTFSSHESIIFKKDLSNIK